MNKPLRQSRKLAMISLAVLATAQIALFSSNTTRGATVTPSSFTLAFAGDFGSSTGSNLVLPKWQSLNPTLSLALGDLNYGAQSSPSAWCGYWKGYVTGNFALVMGNHDTFQPDNLTSEDGMAQRAYWDGSTGFANSCGFNGINPVYSGTFSNGVACSTSTDLATDKTCYGREYYFDYPLLNPIARIIVLCNGIHSPPPYNSPDPRWCTYSTASPGGQAHLNWLDNTIKAAHAAGISWVIVANHKSDWNSGPYGIEYGGPMWNLLIRDKVDLFITGHTHNYERSYQLSCLTGNSDWYNTTTFNPSCIVSTTSSYTQGNGLVYDITGTGGESHEAINSTNPNYPYFAKTNGIDFGFSLLTISGSSMSGKFYDVSNPAFTDSFTIQTSALTAAFSSSPPQPVVGKQATFTATVSGGVEPYFCSWTFGDGTTSDGNPAAQTYTKTGSYNVTLKVTDSAAANTTITYTKTVTVVPQLAASFTYTPSNPEILTTVTFTANAAGGVQPYSFTWDLGDGSTATGPSTNHTYLLPGSYTVTLTVNDSDIQTVSVSQTVTVGVLPGL